MERKKEKKNSLKKTLRGYAGDRGRTNPGLRSLSLLPGKGRRMGVEGEFIGSPRLDDLQCAYGTLMGFLASGEGERGQGGRRGIRRGLCTFDNEEIGSGTKQGLIPPSCPI